MEQNIIVTIPKKGDIVCIDIHNQMQFIDLKSFNLSNLPSGWTTVGVVAIIRGDEVVVLNKTFASKTWSDIYSWALTGFTLDGTERTGVFSYRENSSASANIDKTFTYSAETIDEFVSQLNTWFDESMPEDQEWRAVKENENVSVVIKYSFWQQASYNTAREGLTMTANLMPDVKALARIRRKNGNISGEGAISNWNRALAYFRADNSSTTYNPSSEASLRRNYPICLPGYLGTSQYQDDHCSQLRAKYGEGETGWLKFMESCKPCYPSLVGNMGQRDGKELTYAIKKYTYTDKNGVVKPVSQAADYATSVSYNAEDFKLGNWCMPTVEELYEILDGIKYNSHSSDRSSDLINEALLKLGVSALSNSSTLWSCCRYYANYAWFAYGGYGFFGSYYFNGSSQVLPVAHLKIHNVNS